MMRDACRRASPEDRIHKRGALNSLARFSVIPRPALAAGCKLDWWLPEEPETNEGDRA